MESNDLTSRSMRKPISEIVSITGDPKEIVEIEMKKTLGDRKAGTVHRVDKARSKDVGGTAPLVLPA